MNKVTRMLAMAGMAIAATAAIGAGPATAASATKPADYTASKSGDHRFSKTKAIGYYRSAIVCHKVGNLGEWKRRWDGHSCIRVRGHFHRGSWLLVARWDRKHHGFPGGGHWGGKPDHNDGGGHWGGKPDHDNGNSPWDQKKR